MAIKVILVHPSDPFGPKVGGVETFIKDFIKYAPEDFDIEFIGISSDKIKRPLGKKMTLLLGAKKFDFWALFYEKDENRKTIIPLSLRFTIALKFFKHSFEDKIIFFNRIEPAVLFKKVRAAKIAIIHTDITKHVLNGKSEILWAQFPRIYFIFERQIFEHFDHIYAVSKNTVEYYLKNYPEKGDIFSFLPGCVDTNVFCPAKEEKSHIRRVLSSSHDRLPINERWILFVGRLQEAKAPFRLIKAFSEYHNAYHSGQLIIIGDGNLKNKMMKHAKKECLEDKISFLDNINQEELACFYNAADTLLLTSNFEGMPRCVLEALACGLPVVSTNVGEVKLIVKPGLSGEIVSGTSAKEIALSIEKVLANPQIYTKENCIDSVRDYTPQNVLKPFYEMIEKLYTDRFTVNKKYENN